MHTYPMWGHEDIDTAMPSTIKRYDSVRAAHPDKTIVITEAGWASYTDNKQNAPRAGDEKKQKRYYDDLTAWAKVNNVTTFLFEALTSRGRAKALRATGDCSAKTGRPSW